VCLVLKEKDEKREKMSTEISIVDSKKTLNEEKEKKCISNINEFFK
jgi:hypothetical protein